MLNRLSCSSSTQFRAVFILFPASLSLGVRPRSLFILTLNVSLSLYLSLLLVLPSPRHLSCLVFSCSTICILLFGCCFGYDLKVYCLFLSIYLCLYMSLSLPLSLLLQFCLDEIYRHSPIAFNCIFLQGPSRDIKRLTKPKLYSNSHVYLPILLPFLYLLPLLYHITTQTPTNTYLDSTPTLYLSSSFLQSPVS